MGRGSGGSRDGFCSRSREVGGGRRRRWMKTGGGERWRKWRGEGWLARVTCFKSLASLFNGLLGGKPGQGNVKLYFSAHCNYLAISPFLGLQYKLHVSPWSGNFSSVCISLEHRIILEGKHYLSSHSTWTHFFILQHCRPLQHTFLSPPIPCGSPSLGPTQLREEPARSSAREGWWATQLSACPPHCLHAAYLASSCTQG